MAKSPMHVLVAGANGHTGTLMVQMLKEKGTGKIQLAEKLQHSSTISREDVAQVMVSSLEKPNTIGNRYPQWRNSYCTSS